MVFIILYVTFPNIEEAKKVSKYLIEKRLIACANFIPINSMYRWDNKIQDENETVALLKTKIDNHKLVEKEIKNLHSYDCPCIIKLDVEANKEYEEWIQDETISKYSQS